jgi:KaiC/GvpD/RAD55 family RecA-like ATPase
MSIELHQSEIASYYAVRVPGLRRAGAELRGPCPVHDGKDPNFTVNPNTGLATCHSKCGCGWDVFGLEQALTHTEFKTAKAEVFRIIGREEERNHKKPKPELGPIVAAYDYRDQTGKLIYQVTRHDPKDFRQRRPDGIGGFIGSLEGVTRLPFRLQELIAAKRVVFIPEGEKDCLTLASLGLEASCNSGGAEKFQPEIVPYFVGKKIALLPDNDEKGARHALDVAQKLHGIAYSIKILKLLGLPEKGDVTDFFNLGGTVEQLREIYNTTPIYVPEGLSSPEDKYIRTLREEIEFAGGLNEFWNLVREDGIPTPFRKLTAALGGGFLPGEVYLIGSNTGTGKTSLALQFVITALRAKLGVHIFSMEMNWRSVFQRLVSIEAKVDLNTFRELQRAHIDQPEMRNALARYTREFIDSALTVSTRSRVTPKYLVKESKRLKEKLPKLDFIVVDHMQLMGSDDKNTNEYERFTSISRALKQAAVELSLPVLVVSQMTRSNHRDGGREVELWDLRGSGAIEEDVAAAMLLYQDRDDTKAAKAEGRYECGPVKTWLKLGKNRFGASGLCLPLNHSKRFTRFDPYFEIGNEQ